VAKAWLGSRGGFSRSLSAEQHGSRTDAGAVLLIDRDEPGRGRGMACSHRGTARGSGTSRIAAGRRRPAGGAEGVGQVTGERYGSLKNIPHRTLVVNGHDDIMVPTVNSFILQQKLPDARLMLFPDSGHGSHFQFPEEFAEAAARFLAAD